MSKRMFLGVGILVFGGLIFGLPTHQSHRAGRCGVSPHGETLNVKVLQLSSRGAPLPEFGEGEARFEINFSLRRIKGNIEIDRLMFREYDIRGYAQDIVKDGKVISRNLTPQIVKLIGKAVGSLLPPGATYVVSGDHRLSTAELRQAYVEGLREVGINVEVDLSPVPTGALNWYAVSHNKDGGTQITGSHLGPEWNGLKIMIGQDALFGEELQAVIPMIEQRQFRTGVNRGSLKEIKIVPEYLNMLLNSFPKKFRNKWRFVIDAGNGLGGLLVDALRAKGAEVEGMDLNPDGTFPNGAADPSEPDSLKKLKARVDYLNSDLKEGEIPWIGIKTDGDGDRFGGLEEDGETADPEIIAAIFYRDYLLEPGHKGHVLALDVRASNATRKVVKLYGGIGVFIPPGYPPHRLFAKTIAPNIGKLTVVHVSAEASGHFFFPTAAKDQYGNPVPHAQDILLDDGLYSALKLSFILDNADLNPELLRLRQPGKVGQFTLKELVDTIPRNPTSREVRLKGTDPVQLDKEKVKIIVEFEEIVKQQYRDKMLEPWGEIVKAGETATQQPNTGLIKVSGVRAQLKDGSWFLVRASGTSPELTLKFEARTQKRLVEVLMEVYEILGRFPLIDRKKLWEEIEFQRNKL